MIKCCFWRFDVGSGCYIEDLSKHLTATFVYNAEWAEDTTSLWKKTAIVERTSQSHDEILTCVGSWKRYGLKRVNGFWQSDDVKSAVFKLAVGKHFTKKKSGYVYQISGTVYFPDNGVQFRYEGTLLNSVIITRNDESDDIDDGMWYAVSIQSACVLLMIQIIGFYCREAVYQ